MVSCALSPTSALSLLCRSTSLSSEENLEAEELIEWHSLGEPPCRLKDRGPSDGGRSPIVLAPSRGGGRLVVSLHESEAKTRMVSITSITGT